MSIQGQSAPGPKESSPSPSAEQKGEEQKAAGQAAAAQNAAGQNAAGQAAAAPAAFPQLRKAVVVGGNRIPFARTGGAYTKSSNQDMLTAALDGLIARFGLQDERIGEVAPAPCSSTRATST